MKWPSSTSIMMPTETIGLVIEKMRKMVSCAIGAEAAGLCLPSASNQPIWPRRATIMVTPGMVPLSISRLNASDMRCSRTAESPIDSGFACGSGGVCGAAVCLAAVCAFMVSPVLVIVGDGEDGQVWRRTHRIEQGVHRFVLAVQLDDFISVDLRSSRLRSRRVIGSTREPGRTASSAEVAAPNQNIMRS